MELPAATVTALESLMSSFSELNGEAVEELDSEPSPLEFMRFVSRNTPFVIRGAASNWKATREWNRHYLTEALKDQYINVAVTPYGNADSPMFSKLHGATVLAKPHEEPQQFDDFIDYIIQQETDPEFPADAEVRYAQTQNDNFRGEYSCLFPDAQKDIPFARIALQKQPDAINLWIGNSKSVTAMHKDNFENIFVQVLGVKHFTLLSPLYQACVNEKHILPATYARDGKQFSISLDQGASTVPFATWDPDRPDAETSSLSHAARPLRVSLNPGDMLYLPAMWYHKVKQSCPDADGSNEGFVAAINYWYDMEFRGPLYPLTTFIRDISKPV